MRSFWSFKGNGKYDIGCTGQTVFLYDKQGEELARFKDLKYAYKSEISPKGDIFAVKSNLGTIAVYSLDPPALIKKLRLPHMTDSDENFCFSPDGTELYDLAMFTDKADSFPYPAILIYDTSDFSLKDRISYPDRSVELLAIEYQNYTDGIFLQGYFRNKHGIGVRPFVAKLKDRELKDHARITKEEELFYMQYINLRGSGFARKNYEWTFLTLELEKLKTAGHSLAKLWAYRREHKVDLE